MRSRLMVITTMIVVAHLMCVSSALAVKHIVNMTNFAFSPAKTHVMPGDTVRWVWASGLHTTASDVSSPKSWSSPTLSGAGQNFEVVFNFSDGPGPFPYHCAIHSLTMFDTIFVDYSPKVHVISVSNFAFSPPHTHVYPGDTVLWKWVGGFHNTASDLSSPKAWTSPNLTTSGNFFSLVISAADGPGPFPYHCDVHPLTMMDTLFVDYGPKVHVISVGDFAFTPPKTHIDPGDTVLWKWVSGFHNTASDLSSPKSWTSANLTAAGNFFSLVFTAGDGFGPFPYHCDVHPLTMLDTIFVNGAPPACTTCGDANSDGAVDISDAVFLISHIFSGGAAPGDCNYPKGKGDANGDGTVDISDAVYLISRIFSGGPPPHCQ
jgi:plastocyanin